MGLRCDGSMVVSIGDSGSLRIMIGIVIITIIDISVFILLLLFILLLAVFYENEAKQETRCRPSVHMALGLPHKKVQTPCFDKGHERSGRTSIMSGPVASPRDLPR